MFNVCKILNLLCLNIKTLLRSTLYFLCVFNNFTIFWQNWWTFNESLERTFNIYIHMTVDFLVTVAICCSSSDGTKCLKTNDKNRWIESFMSENCHQILENTFLINPYILETYMVKTQQDCQWYTPFHSTWTLLLSMSIRKLLPSYCQFSWNATHKC
jgi:hypothetical protein